MSVLSSCSKYLVHLYPPTCSNSARLELREPWQWRLSNISFSIYHEKWVGPEQSSTGIFLFVCILPKRVILPRWPLWSFLASLCSWGEQLTPIQEQGTTGRMVEPGVRLKHPLHHQGKTGCPRRIRGAAMCCPGPLQHCIERSALSPWFLQ